MSDENTPEVSEFIASGYALHAKRQDDLYLATDNPAPLPRFYITQPDGQRKEIIRGFDVCLKHSVDNPAIGCGEKPKARGLCARCRQQASYLISTNLTTWDMLEAAHAALPSPRSSGRSDVISMKDFILSLGASK